MEKTFFLLKIVEKQIEFSKRPQSSIDPWLQKNTGTFNIKEIVKLPSYAKIQATYNVADLVRGMELKNLL